MSAPRTQRSDLSLTWRLSSYRPWRLSPRSPNDSGNNFHMRLGSTLSARLSFNPRLDSPTEIIYLDIKINYWVIQSGSDFEMDVDELESGVHIWLVMWKAARAVEACAMKSIASAEMCSGDFTVLEALLHKGALPVNVIGRKVLLTSGSITTAIDRLEKKGLVERRDDARDRRTRIVHLTREGRKLIKKAFDNHAADMERIASVLKPGERATLIRLLKKVGKEAAQSLERDKTERAA